MNLNPIQPRKSLNKAFLKLKPNRSQIESFKTHLIELIDAINENESEEFHKNLISDFLKNTYYSPNHFINTKGRKDQVIHNGKNAKSTVGVIIEAKKPTNTGEMIKMDNINKKAFQELVLYYLRERIIEKNLEVKYLIVTNIYEWFIFDAQLFDRLFAQNNKLVKQFTDFEENRLSESKTDFFYHEIAEPFINEIKSEIEFTHFDIREYDKPLRNDDKKDDNKLIALFKLLSPEHLLKLPFTNDSNTLDKKFYSELLHIIGLIETKQGSKKLISRKPENDRDPGSLIENAINILKYEDCLSQIKASQYGETKEEQFYHVALELVITWINRILFLKLLEGQLIRYHKGDTAYKFLNYERIPDYDALNKLFFQVLAIKEVERNEMVKKKFGKIPYLNSSLFEPNDLEHKTIRISNLEDEYSLNILSASVLKDKTGKKISGNINTLEYLFSFLDAYDFASEGAEEIQEENKTLINASVLGLIFEKINGYKDGSFFTPGFITMYMSRETIRRAVVQKFNETKDWNCSDLDKLYDKIEDRNEANQIINSLKICDPAVGSGHFLVSALNEIIAIKNDLKVLQDREGKRLKEYHVEVVNDELIITDEDGEFFEYNPTSHESQRVQEALFHEKQTIIENCLFGVDINFNSVKICRLRLWIELLKNAYYKPGTEELETLPNIDINIKCGNSLISRYALDADIKKALKKSKWSIDSYRLAVMTYRNAHNKDEKKAMQKLIDEIKNDFESEVALSDKRVIKLSTIKGKLLALTTQTQLFEQTKKEKAEWNKKVSKHTTDIEKLETELEEIKSNKIYENAFEWRFEFPEVLNDGGDFVGFDVVIGNPPYYSISTFERSLQNYFTNSSYTTFTKGSDIYCLFYELGFNILKQKAPICFITSNRFCFTNYGIDLRRFLSSKNILAIINFNDINIFENANVGSLIMITENRVHSDSKVKALDFKESSTINSLEYIVKSKAQLVDKEYLQENQWSFDDNNVQKIKLKIESKGVPFLKWEDISINRGITTGLNQVFIISEKQKNEIIKEDPNSKDILKPILKGANIKRYKILPAKEYLIYTYTDIKIEDYPGVYKYLIKHKDLLEEVYEAKHGQKKWYELRKCTYYDKFKEMKLIWTRLSNINAFAISKNREFTVDSSSFAVSKDIKYLASILNSKVIFFYFKLGSVVWGKDGIKWFGNYFDNIPIPRISMVEKKQLITLVDKIIQNKNQGEDTIELEKEIDKLVYQLYDLTEEEIEIVENQSKK